MHTTYAHLYKWFGNQTKHLLHHYKNYIDDRRLYLNFPLEKKAKKVLFVKLTL